MVDNVKENLNKRTCIYTQNNADTSLIFFISTNIINLTKPCNHKQSKCKVAWIHFEINGSQEDVPTYANTITHAFGVDTPNYIIAKLISFNVRKFNKIHATN